MGSTRFNGQKRGVLLGVVVGLCIIIGMLKNVGTRGLWLHGFGKGCFLVCGIGSF